MRTTQPVSNNFAGPMRIALIVGLVAAVIGVAGLFISGAALFFQGYLIAFLLWLGIALGSLALLFLHYAVGTRWALTIRRVVEAGAATLPLMALFFIPLLIGMGYLYIWAQPQAVAASEVLKAKSFYLNVPFFIIRGVIYFAVWILLAWVANRWSARRVQTTNHHQGTGALGLILYGLTMSFASVDWLMSLEPEWTSTAFGVVIILAQVQTAMAFALVMLNVFPGLMLGKRFTYKDMPVQYNDLGALTMTLVMAYTYVAFFQLLIQWAGNIPREVIWYVHRVEGGWNLVAIFMAIFQFVLPFIALLTIRVRHNLRALGIISAVLLFTNLVTLIWHVKPVFSPSLVSISWLDIVLPVAMGGIWFAAFLYMLARRPELTPEEQAAVHLTGTEEKAI